jgi:NitT/TauT family transport system permease protein
MTIDETTATSVPVDAMTPPPGSIDSRRAGGIPVAKIIGPIGVFGLIIGAWYFVSGVVLDPQQQFMFPLPHDIAKAFFDVDNIKELGQALRWTTEEALIGLAFSCVGGIGLAVLMSRAKWIEQSIYPWAVVLQTVPVLALTPLLSFFFGFSLTARVIVCFLISFFPMISNTLFGLHSADRGMHDLFTLHHASWFTRMRKLQFPAALPAIFAGLRVSAGLAVIGAIVGDMFFKQGNAGIGTLLSSYTSYLQGDKLFAAVLLSSAVGILLFLLTGWLSKLVVGKWYHPTKD